jgi:hypothetical protein
MEYCQTPISSGTRVLNNPGVSDSQASLGSIIFQGMKVSGIRESGNRKSFRSPGILNQIISGTQCILTLNVDLHSEYPHTPKIPTLKES